MILRRSLLSFILAGVFFISCGFLLFEQFVTTQPWSLLDSAQSNSDAVSFPAAHPSKDDDSLTNDIPFEDIHVSSPLLRAQLKRLLELPALSHAQSIAANEERCSREIADKQVNQEQLRDLREWWIDVNEDEIRARRTAIVRYLENLNEQHVALVGGDAKLEGKGIVMTAGNKNTASSALTILRLLRQNYQSRLPVQIFSFPGEVNENIALQFQELDATHHELSNVKKVNGAWKNFQLKAAAIVSSTFAEVLYLDSDNIPLRDPVDLFSDPAYKKTGAVFWPDYNKDHPDNAVWRILGKTCFYSEWQVESGQILIDKTGNGGVNLAALHVATHMQLNHDFWFRISGGDKDTFRYAFWALNIPYMSAPRWLSPLGSSVRDKFCGYVMLQYDIGKDKSNQYPPLFLHANLLKHRSTSRGMKVFRTIKRARYDDASSQSLDVVKAWVSDSGGMCVEIAIDESTQILESGLKQEVIEEQFVEIYNGLFQDVEDRWLRAGGLIAAW